MIVVGGLTVEPIRPEGGLDAEPEVEDVDHQQTQPEERHRGAHQGDHPGDLVDDLAAAYRAGDAERHADEDRDQQCGGAQFDGGGKAGGEILGDRLAGVPGVPEIAAEDAQHVVEELGDQGLIQPHFDPEAFDRGGVGLFAGEDRGGITWEHPGDDEDGDQDSEKGRDHREQAS